MNTYGSPKYVVIYLEDSVYPGGYKGKRMLVVLVANERSGPKKVKRLTHLILTFHKQLLAYVEVR